MKHCKKFFLLLVSALSFVMLAFGATGCALLGGAEKEPEEPKVETPVCNHQWGEWKETQEKTCVDAGEYVRVCSLCKVAEETSFPAPGHTFVKDEENSVVPTCTVEGVAAEKCTVCGETKTKNLGYGHELESHEAKAVNCEEIGWGAYETCKLCEYTTYVEIPATGHSMVNVAAKAVTCVTDGNTAYSYCENANCPVAAFDKATLEAANLIPVHSTVAEGKNCPVCQYLEYELSKDADGKDVATVTGIGNFKGDYLVIPQSYCGALVRAIADDAFANSKIKTVEIPYKVATIGKNAFKGSSVESIVVHGSALKEIGESAFEKTALKSVVLPDSVLTLGANAFNGSALEDITLGSRIVEIGEGAFWNCSTLKAINVSDKNMKFSSIAGSLYNKDGSKLYYYAAGKDASSFFAGDQLVAIEKDAFLGAQLKNIVLPFLGANVNEPAALGYLFGDKVPATLKEVTVTGGVIVDSAFEGCENLSKVSLVGSVSSVGKDAFKDCLGLMYVEYGDYITEVKADAFYMCHRLVEVKLGKSVKTIGARAFENCADLKTVVFSEKLETIGSSAFSNCDSLTNIVIPDNVEKIGNSAFFDCDNLKSIAIGTAVTKIGEFAFRSCGNLEYISVNQDNVKYKSIEGNLYTKDGTTLVQYAVGKADPYFNVPDEVVEISAGAFEDGGDGLVEVTIGAGVKVIGDAAFAYCWNITNIKVSANNENYMSVDGNLYTKDGKTLIRYGVGKTESSFEVPSTVETIVEGAFFGEDKLETLTVYFVGESVSTEKNAYLGHLFGARAYNDNATFVPESLKNVIVKECDAIGFGAFYGCNLEELTVPFTGNELNGDKNTHFGYIFGATSEENNGTYVPETLKKVVLTDATVVAKNAFKGCNSIEEIILPVGVEVVGESAFEACTALKKINLPATLQTIGAYAFWNCENLEMVSIPSSVTMISAGAFRGCKNLKTLVLGSSVEEIAAYAFEGCEALKMVEIPSSVKTIRMNAFAGTGLISVSFVETSGWTAAGETVDVSNAATAADLLSDSYANAEWQR